MVIKNLWELGDRTIVNVFSGAGLKITSADLSELINPADGTSHNFSGNPWGIGNSASSSVAPNRDFSQRSSLRR